MRNDDIIINDLAERNHETLPALRIPVSIRDVVEEWLRGLSDKTRRAYEGDLRRFAKYYGMSIPRAMDMLIERGHGHANMIALQYQNHLKHRNLSNATVNRAMCSIRAALRVLRVAGIVPWTIEVRPLRQVNYRDTRGPGIEGFREMLGQCQGPELMAMRNRALLRILFDLGLRRNEVATLDIEHVDWRGERLFVLAKRKGGERVWVTIPKSTLRVVFRFLEARGSPMAGPVFTNFDRSGKGGNRLTADGIYRIIRKLGESAGVGIVRPHGLRHAAITTVLDNGVSMRDARKFARLESLQTLDFYDDARQDLGGRVATGLADLVEGGDDAEHRRASA